MSDKVFYREHWGSNSLKKEEDETSEDYNKRLIDLIKHWQQETLRLNKICVQFAPTCEGCLENQGNQMGHTGAGGCLYIPDIKEEDESDIFYSPKVEDEDDELLILTPPSPIKRQVSLQHLRTDSLEDIENLDNYYYIPKKKL